jgi:hypothetical protein
MVISMRTKPMVEHRVLLVAKHIVRLRSYGYGYVLFVGACVRSYSVLLGWKDVRVFRRNHAAHSFIVWSLYYHNANLGPTLWILHPAFSIRKGRSENTNVLGLLEAYPTVL